MSHKQLKEEFVSGLTGGSVQEIYAVTGTALAALLAHTCVQRWLVPRIPILTKFPVLFIVTFYFDVLIQLQAITIYGGRVLGLYYTAASIAIGAFVFGCIYVAGHKQHKQQKQQKQKKQQKQQKQHKEHKEASKRDTCLETLGQIPYITAYRSQMLVITNLAILAVDFHVFPRRFAKVETWGTSMMDLGVGLFVFSMGLANSRSLIKKSLAKHQNSQTYLRLLWGNTLKALPVLCLGLVRLVSVKSLDYQEHVSEYGVHWNFFMTLGLLPVFLGIVDPLFAVVPRFIVALAIGIVYECMLTHGGLGRYVLDESNRHDNLFTLNKEGLASFVGYLSIFIFGQSFGSFVLPTRKLPNNLVGIGLPQKPRRWLTVSPTQGLVIATLVLFGLFHVSAVSVFTGAISRRLANLPYVLWVVSYNAAMLLGYNLAERLAGPIDSKILNAINKNGLAIFLAANLATGLVNMGLNTLQASDGMAYSILIVYSLSWVGLALALDHYKVYIKI